MVVGWDMSITCLQCHKVIVIVSRDSLHYESGVFLTLSASYHVVERVISHGLMD